MEQKHQFKSIRSFIGAKDFDVSRSFYKDLGFTEIILSENMSVFKIDEKLSFYLQKAYVKNWEDNSMIFLEVEDLEFYLEKLKAKKISEKYPKVRVSEIVNNDWGKEFFVHDPSGILWHMGCFYLKIFFLFNSKSFPRYTLRTISSAANSSGVPLFKMLP